MPNRRTVLTAGTVGLTSLILPSAAHAASGDGSDPDAGGDALRITGASGSDSAVTLDWTDTQ